MEARISTPGPTDTIAGARMNIAGNPSNILLVDFAVISNDLDCRPKKLRHVFTSIPPMCVSPYRLFALTEDKVISPSLEPPPRLDET